MHLNRPIIFLASANEVPSHQGRLNLPLEHSTIRELLENVNDYELIERQNVTFDEIQDVFQKSGNRILISHYAGHSNSSQLLLNKSNKEETKTIHSEGFISFLKDRNTLKLIFLNGCSSHAIASELSENNSICTIGTHDTVNDDVARMVSERFYKGLVNGRTVKESWKDTEDNIIANYGSISKRDLSWSGKDSEIDTFPWDLCGEDYAEWRLSDINDSGYSYFDKQFKPEDVSLIGVGIDVSQNMYRTIQNIKIDGQQKSDILQVFEYISSKIFGFCQTPESREVLPLIKLFVYGFGFGILFKEAQKSNCIAY